MKTMKLKMAFVMDPVETINTEKDTTFVLMLEAQARGHEVWFLELKDLFVKENKAFCNATQITLERSESFYKLGETRTFPMESFDAVWMRKDPPVNNDFLYATYILSLLNDSKTKVLNNPTGIRESNEKLYSLFFPEIIPQSVVTKNISQLQEFLTEVGGEMVVKPLDGHGGKEYFMCEKATETQMLFLKQSQNLGQST